MFYLSFIAGIIFVILSVTGFWTIPIWVGVAFLAVPVLIIVFFTVIVGILAWAASGDSVPSWTR